MSFDIEAELKKVFEEAIRSREAQSLKTPDDWRRLSEISEQTARQIKSETDRFLDEYDTRVEVARKRLIDEAGSKRLDHYTPDGQDKFDAKAISRQAHRQVQFDHERLIEQIKQNERAQTQSLVKEAQARNLPHGKARDDFNQVNDRRKGQDRRLPQRSR